MPTIEDAVRVLNEAYERDPEAVARLVTSRVSCNEHLADHPLILSGKDEDQRSVVGMIGLLNGIFGDAKQAVGASYEFDGDGSLTLVGFCVLNHAVEVPDAFSDN
ncbi:hypothetical protein ACYOEI_40425 [Singulisphaera rosea]